MYIHSQALQKYSTISRYNGAPYTGYFFAISLSYALLYSFSTVPLVALLCAELVLCGFIATLFPGIRYRWIVFLYPALVFLISQSFTGDWFEAGDGVAHTPAAEALYRDGLLDTVQGVIDSYGTASVFVLAKTLSLGASIGYQLVFHFFDLPVAALYQDVFVVSQGFVFLCLITLLATIIRKWNLLDERFAFIFVAFLLISPTVLEANAAPNRHLITLAGLSLLCVTHLALMIKISPTRIAFYCLAIFIIILSKAPLLMPYVAFTLFALGLSTLRHHWIFFVLLASFAIIIIPDSYTYYSGIFSAYDEQRVMGMATFDSGVMDIPVIGWSIKYLYALLSPFPWFKYDHFVSTNYTGSYLLFVLHMLSSLTGVYLFSVLIMKWRMIISLFKTDFQFRIFILFGMVMSTSILAGSTGFHGYLSIYFPFLSTVLAYKTLRISYLIPLGLVMMALVVAAVA